MYNFDEVTPYQARAPLFAQNVHLRLKRTLGGRTQYGITL